MLLSPDPRQAINVFRWHRGSALIACVVHSPSLFSRYQQMILKRAIIAGLRLFCLRSSRDCLALLQKVTKMRHCWHAHWRHSWSFLDNDDSKYPPHYLDLLRGLVYYGISPKLSIKSHNEYSVYRGKNTGNID